MGGLAHDQLMSSHLLNHALNLINFAEGAQSVRYSFSSSKVPEARASKVPEARALKVQETQGLSVLANNNYD